VPAGVRRAPRAASAARRWLAQTATLGGRFAGPSTGGGRAASVRRGRKRALRQRRDGATRGRPGQLAGAGGPTVGRGRVRRRP